MESGQDAPALSVAGFGPLDSNGQATFPTTAPPAVVKVTSSAGGSDSETPIASGAGFSALAPVAQFVAPVTVQAVDPVPLDGAASIGTITKYALVDQRRHRGAERRATPRWPPGPRTRVNAAATVTLTVTGPGGTNAATNTVNVTPPSVVTADAGPTRSRPAVRSSPSPARRPGSRSVLWTQVSGPTVTLSSTTSLTPTFTYPKMALPVGPAGHVNTGYVVNNDPIVLQLTATPTRWRQRHREPTR